MIFFKEGNLLIIKVIGGMGNQMFQYALYLALKHNGKDVKLDVSELDAYLKGYNRASLFNIFNLDYEKATDKEVRKLAYVTFVDRLRRRLNIFPKRTYVKEAFEGCFDNRIFDLENAYLDGYWQSFKYFSCIREKILEAFTFPLLDDKNLFYKRLIEECQNSVSVHIRLGDYLNTNCANIYGNICTEDYYTKSIRFIQENHKDITVFLFSNEPDKAKNLLTNQNIDKVITVDCNSERNGWIDMYLMSLCKFNIIANSTFSWWAAWLNQHSDRLVIAPKKWLNTKEMPDICPKEWVRL